MEVQFKDHSTLDGFLPPRPSWMKSIFPKALVWNSWISSLAFHSSFAFPRSRSFFRTFMPGEHQNTWDVWANRPISLHVHVCMIWNEPSAQVETLLIWVEQQRRKKHSHLPYSNWKSPQFPWCAFLKHLHSDTWPKQGNKLHYLGTWNRT